MFKTFLITLITLTSTITYAQKWEKIGEDAEVINYIDRTSVRKNGSKFKIWGLTNFKIQEPDGVFSQRYQDEFDCVNENRRTTYISSHYGKFADGGIKFNSPIEGEWRPIPPGTVANKILRTFCI